MSSPLTDFDPGQTYYAYPALANHVGPTRPDATDDPAATRYDMSCDTEPVTQSVSRYHTALYRLAALDGKTDPISAQEKELAKFEVGTYFALYHALDNIPPEIKLEREAKIRAERAAKRREHALKAT